MSELGRIRSDFSQEKEEILRQKQASLAVAYKQKEELVQKLTLEHELEMDAAKVLCDQMLRESSRICTIIGHSEFKDKWKKRANSRDVSEIGKLKEELAMKVKIL